MIKLQIERQTIKNKVSLVIKEVDSPYSRVPKITVFELTNAEFTKLLDGTEIEIRG